MLYDYPAMTTHVKLMLKEKLSYLLYFVFFLITISKYLHKRLPITAINQRCLLTTNFQISCVYYAFFTCYNIGYNHLVGCKHETANIIVISVSF